MLKIIVKGFGIRLSQTGILTALYVYVTMPNHLSTLRTFILISNMDDIDSMGLVGLFTKIIQVRHSFYTKQITNKY